jgi:hypothetical protein
VIKEFEGKKLLQRLALLTLLGTMPTLTFAQAKTEDKKAGTQSSQTGTSNKKAGTQKTPPAAQNVPVGTQDGPVPKALMDKKGNDQMPNRFQPPVPNCGYTGAPECFYVPRDGNVGAMNEEKNTVRVGPGHPAPPPRPDDVKRPAPTVPGTVAHAAAPVTGPAPVTTVAQPYIFSTGTNAGLVSPSNVAVTYGVGSRSRLDKTLTDANILPAACELTSVTYSNTTPGGTTPMKLNVQLWNLTKGKLIDGSTYNPDFTQWHAQTTTLPLSGLLTKGDKIQMRLTIPPSSGWPPNFYQFGLSAKLGCVAPPAHK